MIERKSVNKFLGVSLYKNLTWSAHINTIKTKIAKNIGLLYKARHLDKERLKQLYLSYIHSYLRYTNMVRASLQETNLKRLR